MEASKTVKRIEIVSGSGMLRVVPPPRRSWFLILLEVVLFSVAVIWVYSIWAKLPLLYHLLFLWGFAAAFLGLIYRISVSQVIEFDSQRIVVRKDIRGWERKKQYSVEDCSELEWQEGTEDSPAALSCNVGRRTVKLCEQLSEEESIEILAALQQGLPDVAQKICSYPESKEHFITLGLNRQQKS